MMRSTLTTISVATLLAAGAGPATARPDVSPAPTPAVSRHAVAAPSLGVQHRYLGSYLTPVAVSPARSTPATVVQVTPTPAADGGFDWTDVGIGAGLATALLLTAAGVSAVRHAPGMRTH